MGYGKRSMCVACRTDGRFNLLKHINPKHLCVEVSSSCQLRCPSCPTASGAVLDTLGKGHLRFEDFRGLLKRNPQVESIELANYGEAFLNPALIKMLSYAEECGVELHIGTGANLNHVKPEVLEGVVRFRLRTLRCSIDGAGQASYSRYRVGGDFDRVVENIRKINQFKQTLDSNYPKLIWQFIVFGHNENEISEAQQLARELGMDFQLKLSWDEDFSPIRDKERVRELLGVASRKEYLEKTGQDYMRTLCHQLWDSPQINWDGKILGCCRNFWGEFGGNAFTDGLIESINGEKIHYARNMLLGKKPPRSDIPCTTCDLYRTMQQSEQWLERPPTSLYKKLKRHLRHHFSKRASD
jgi:MoaA/NifB/PqqE/SkfB family radical SAM enzyme